MTSQLLMAAYGYQQSSVAGFNYESAKYSMDGAFRLADFQQQQQNAHAQTTAAAERDTAAHAHAQQQQQPPHQQHVTTLRDGDVIRNDNSIQFKVNPAYEHVRYGHVYHNTAPPTDPLAGDPYRWYIDRQSNPLSRPPYASIGLQIKPPIAHKQLQAEPVTVDVTVQTDSPPSCCYPCRSEPCCAACACCDDRCCECCPLCCCPGCYSCWSSIGSCLRMVFCCGCCCRKSNSSNVSIE